MHSAIRRAFLFAFRGVWSAICTTCPSSSCSLNFDGEMFLSCMLYNPGGFPPVPILYLQLRLLLPHPRPSIGWARYVHPVEMAQGAELSHYHYSFSSHRRHYVHLLAAVAGNVDPAGVLLHGRFGGRSILYLRKGAVLLA